MVQVATSGDLKLRLLYLEKGTVFPQHCYEDAVEILHILAAGHGAQIGLEGWLESVEVDRLYSYISTRPKMIKVLNEISQGKCKTIHDFHFQI